MRCCNCCDVCTAIELYKGTATIANLVPSIQRVLMELSAVCTAARRVNVVYVQCSFMQYIFDEISDGVSCG